MTEPIRLAVVSDAVEPFHTGGKEARYAALLPRIARRGVAVDVHTMKWWSGGARTTAVGDLTMHALSPYVPLYTRDRRSVLQAAVFAASSVRMLFRRYDVLEADAIPFVQLYPLWVVARLRRRPFLVTWHEVWGRDYWREYLGPLGVVAAWLERTAARLPSAIVATSEETGRRVRELRGAARPASDVVVVPPGVHYEEIATARDVAASRRSAPSDASDGGGAVEILCVGRLLAHKNVDLVIAALARLRGAGREVRLTVIGQGPERDRLVAQAAGLGLDGHVTFLEPLAERSDLLARIAAADVVAFPTVREGFGMVALEALACGVPVVTSDHPDNYARTLVVDGVTGRVCPPTVEAVTAALADVLDRREELAIKAAPSVADYDWENLSARVADVVTSLAGRSRPRGAARWASSRGVPR